MPGWQGSNRKAELPPDWEVRRLRVLRRDSYRCQWKLPDGSICGAPANQVDHQQRGNDHAESNLRALCAPHHAHKSGQEGAAARRYIPKNRPPERHPGLK